MAAPVVPWPVAPGAPGWIAPPAWLCQDALNGTGNGTAHPRVIPLPGPTTQVIGLPDYHTFTRNPAGDQRRRCGTVNNRPWMLQCQYCNLNICGTCNNRNIQNIQALQEYAHVGVCKICRQTQMPNFPNTGQTNCAPTCLRIHTPQRICEGCTNERWHRTMYLAVHGNIDFLRRNTRYNFRRQPRQWYYQWNPNVRQNAKANCACGRLNARHKRQGMTAGGVWNTDLRQCMCCWLPPLLDPRRQIIPAPPGLFNGYDTSYVRK
jgi:hypothetical protein